MPHPPHLVSSVYEVVEYDAYESPHDKVDRSCWEESSGAGEDEWNIDAFEKSVVRVPTREQPNGHWCNDPNEEEVVHLPVVAESAKHTQRSYDTPDDGSIVKDVISWTCPGATLR